MQATTSIPPSPDRKAAFARLSEELRAGPPRDAEIALRFGCPEIDGALPGGGLAAGIHEICPAGPDLPDEAASTKAIALLMARADGPVLWVLGHRFLFAPGLAEAGLSPDRLHYAELGDEALILSVAEDALRHGSLGGVVAETHELPLKASRRLQLAAESSGTPALILRRWKRSKAPLGGTAALTRWQIGVCPSAAADGLPRASWRLELARCRGGVPRRWNVELQESEDAYPPLRLRLAARLAGDPADAASGRTAA